MAELANVDGHRLRPADQEPQPRRHRHEWKQDRANRIRMHERIQRHAAQQPRRRIAESISGPRVRHLVDRQREQQHDERYEDLADVDVQEGPELRRDLRLTLTGYG